MKLIIPLTGTVVTESPLIGDENDPIRPIDLNLGNVSWRMVVVDITNEVMEIEVLSGEVINELTGGTDGDGNPKSRRRKATEQEKAGFLQHAQDVVNHTKDELYLLTNCAKLKRPHK